MGQITIPETAVIHITENCTHRCPHCYVGNGMGLNGVADIQVLCKITDKLNKIGVKNVGLLGGDPVKYPHVFELLKHIKTNTHLKTILMSNTFLADVEITDHMMSMYVDVAETTVHGIDAESHDAHCGVAGAYDSLVNKLIYYQAQGVTIGVAINLAPSTYDKLFDIINNFHNHLSGGVSHVVVQRIIPSGLAESDSDKYALTAKQVNTSFEQIDKISRELSINVSVEDTFPMCIVDPIYHKYLHRCEWGISKFSLKADGSFSRCGATPNQSIGNVLHDDFLSVWQNAAQLVEFRDLSYLSERCKNCEFKHICGGGCPLSSQVQKLGSDYLVDDCSS